MPLSKPSLPPENASDARAKFTTPRTSAKSTSPSTSCITWQPEHHQIADAQGRSPPPGPPSHLPFAPSTANIPEMKAWLLNWYAPSIFNKFPHQPLPRMDGPPVEIHLVEDDVSRKVAMPATIPLHWQEQVKADLECDVALGVIERMEEPSEWCQRMVCVHKAWLLNWYAP